MCPQTSFPLWREKGLREGIQTSPHPRTDPNYRFGLSQSQSTFHQITLECIHFPPSAKQTKTHIHILCKLLVVRNAFAGGSQEELLESYQPVLAGSSLTKGSSRLHTEYTSGHQCDITLWLNIFCFKGGAVFRKMVFPSRAVPCEDCIFN